MYNGLADLYREQGQFEKAFECIDKAINIYCRTLPKEHPYIAEAYNSKGGIYFIIRDFQSALEWYVKAYNIRMAAYGYDHTETAKSLANIGEIYLEEVKQEEAIEDKVE